MQEVFVVSGKRTPIGNFMGSLKDVSNVELGIVAAKAAMEQINLDPAKVGHVSCGCVLQEASKPNVGRQVQLGAGIPVEAGAMTVNQLCSSSMRAAEIGADMIRVGREDIVLVVGTESMTNPPYMVSKCRM